MVQFDKINRYKNIFFTSDTHYSHKNICRGTSSWEDKSRCRDFNTVQDMNKALISGINDYVSKDDVLIHCGDVSFGGINNLYNFLGNINCDIILCYGNHDHLIRNYSHSTKVHKIINSSDLQYLNFHGFRFMCSHYPMVIWHQSHKDIPLAFGHVHGTNPGLGKSQDVGVDVAYELFGEYRVFTQEEFESLAGKKKTHLESHHNNKTN